MEFLKYEWSQVMNIFSTLGEGFIDQLKLKNMLCNNQIQG